MKTRNLLLTSVLSLFCTAAASCTCPTGTFVDNGATMTFQLATAQDGIVSGSLSFPAPCETEYPVTGTSNGTLVQFSATLPDPDPDCPCYGDPLQFSLTAENLCALLDGTVAGCGFPKPLAITLVKPAL